MRGGFNSLINLAPKKRILIVDDDVAVNAVTAEMVRALGHLAVVAWDINSAVSIWNETGRAFDMVIVDYILNDGFGTSLAERLALEKPGMPVLLVSGMSQEDIEIRPGVQFLEKPFTVEDLWKAIDAAKSW